MRAGSARAPNRAPDGAWGGSWPRFARGNGPETLEDQGAIALRTRERLNPDHLKYARVFVGGAATQDRGAGAMAIVGERDPGHLADLAVADRLKDLILGADGKRIAKIILFGSRARGDARPDSDYDLLVVMRGLGRTEWNHVEVSLYDAVRGAGVVAEPHLITVEQFEETKGIVGSLAYPAAKEGVVLYASAG